MRKDKLDKLEMPMPEKDEMLELEELDMELEDEEMPEDEEAESPLADFSDDELLEEAMKRGLSMDDASEDMEDEEDDLEDL